MHSFFHSKHQAHALCMRKMCMVLACCLQVMLVVKGLTQSGVMVLATIHSPTQSTFRLFDSMLMLVNGQEVYFGSAGEAALRLAEGLHLTLFKL